MSNGSTTGVELHLGFFPLAFFLFFCSPRVEVDGTVQRSGWGKHVLDLPVGRYTITVYFPYFTMSRCGENSISVDVAEGRTTRVKYYMPPWMLAKGSLTVS